MKIDFTERELNIIENISKGFSNAEIGKILFVSKHTVKANLERIYLKTGCSNRVQLTIWALKNNIISLPQ